VAVWLLTGELREDSEQSGRDPDTDLGFRVRWAIRPAVYTTVVA
jgi:hypothetical protein